MADAITTWGFNDASPRYWRWWLNTTLADTLATAAEPLREGCTAIRRSLLRIRSDRPTPLTVYRYKTRCHHQHASKFRLFESLRFRSAPRMKFLPDPKSSTDPTLISTESSLTWRFGNSTDKYGSRWAMNRQGARSAHPFGVLTFADDMERFKPTTRAEKRSSFCLPAGSSRHWLNLSIHGHLYPSCPPNSLPRRAKSPQD